jgi:hypothetical protein
LQDDLVHGDGVVVLGHVEVHVAQALEHLFDVWLVFPPLVEGLHPLQPSLLVGQGVAVPVRLREADAQVLHRLGTQVGSELVAARLLTVGPLDQIVEFADGLGEAVVAVV